MRLQSRVFWALLVRNGGGFLDLYLEGLLGQTYPLELITLYIRTNDNSDETENILENFIQNNGQKFEKVIYNNSSIDSTLSEYGQHEWNSYRFNILNSVRQESISACIKQGCDYYFVSDADNFIVPETLSKLVDTDLPIVAPMLRLALPDKHDPMKLDETPRYSNFHHISTEDQWFQENPASNLYDLILNREIRGIFQVELIHCTYLVRKDVLRYVNYHYHPGDWDYKNNVKSLVSAGVPIYLDNRTEYGMLTFENQSVNARKELRSLKHRHLVAGRIILKVVHYAGVFPGETVRARKALLAQLALSRHFPVLKTKSVIVLNQSGVEKALSEKTALTFKSGNKIPWNTYDLSVWFSHVEIFTDFLRSNYPSIMLVESEIWMGEQFLDVLANSYLELPEDWDFLAMFRPEHLLAGLPRDSYYEFLTSNLTGMSSLMIIYSRSGAQKILNYSRSGVSLPLHTALQSGEFGEQLKGFTVSPDRQGQISVYTELSALKIQALPTLPKFFIDKNQIISVDSDIL